MPRVIHFEIPAKDSVKIVAFYKEVFDWQFMKWEGPAEYWLAQTGEEGTPGINGGLYSPETGFVGTVNTIDVPDLDAFISKVKANGGIVVAEKMPVPGVGWLAYCKDVEGNVFGMMQSDVSVGTGQ